MQLVVSLADNVSVLFSVVFFLVISDKCTYTVLSAVVIYPFVLIVNTCEIFFCEIGLRPDPKTFLAEYYIGMHKD